MTDGKYMWKAIMNSIPHNVAVTFWCILLFCFVSDSRFLNYSSFNSCNSLSDLNIESIFGYNFGLLLQNDKDDSLFFFSLKTNFQTPVRLYESGKLGKLLDYHRMGTGCQGNQPCAQRVWTQSSMRDRREGWRLSCSPMTKYLINYPYIMKAS
jgi:hypothetical protein